MIKISRFFSDLKPGVNSLVCDVTISELRDRYMEKRLPDLICEALAKRYAEEFGDEILKAIQQKTIEPKVIAKVVANLRKELRKEKQ